MSVAQIRFVTMGAVEIITAHRILTSSAMATAFTGTILAEISKSFIGSVRMDAAEVLARTTITFLCRQIQLQTFPTTRQP